MANCLRLAASLDWPYTHNPGDGLSRCPAPRRGPSVAIMPPAWHGMLACACIPLVGAWVFPLPVHWDVLEAYQSEH